VDRVNEEVEPLPEVRQLVDFLAASQRGVAM